MFFYNPLIAPQKRLENGYTVGRDAGQLIVNAPTAVMEGEVIATVYQGPQQVRARDAVGDAYLQAQTATPKAATLSFGQYGPGGLLAVGNTDIRIGDIAGVTDGMAADAVLPVARSNTLWLDAGLLSAQGWGEIDLATSGTLSIDAPLTLHDGGVLNLIAPVVDFAADVTAHSGSITASNVFQSALPNAHARELLRNNAADVIAHDGVTLDVSGLWVNALLDGGDTSKSAFINGGAVTLESTGDVTLATGSLIDVASGAAILGTGKTLGGKGGNVSLIADSTRAISTLTGNLTLNGDIRAYGVNGGGTLSIESGSGIAIGGKILGTNGVLAAGEETPIDLTALEDFTVHAGDVLPADYHYTRTFAMPGEMLGGAPGFSAATPITLAADWKPPRGLLFSGLFADYVLIVDGVNVTIPGQQYERSAPTLHAGSVITGYIGVHSDGVVIFPTSYVMPVAAFPGGVPVAPTPAVLAAGSTAPNDVVFNAGTSILAGAVLSEAVAVKPLLNIDSALLRSGFSNYDVAGHQGLAVAPQARLDIETPVYRFTADAFSAPTGVNANLALDVWTPPVYREDPSKDIMTQRAGGDLTLRSDGSISIGKAAVVTVDPGHSINIAGNIIGPVVPGGRDQASQITIDGTLDAWGGRISINTQQNNPDGISQNHSIWIGSDAVLDVAGRAVTARDQAGHTYGFVQRGGSISVGGDLDWEVSGQAAAPDLFVIIRPGAVLDASGARAILSLPSGAIQGATQALPVASDGGSIILKSNNGLYLDGTMLAKAGGAGAAGGTLAIALETPLYITQGGQLVDDGVRMPRDFVIAQQQGDSTLGNTLRPAASDPALVYGMARLGVDAIHRGGFDNLSVLSNGFISFDGNVDLQLAQSLRFYSYAEALTAGSAGNASVSLTAPHVLLAGATRHLEGNPFELMPTVTNSMAGKSQQASDARFSVTADLIDIRDLVGFGAGGSIELNNASLAVDRRGFADVDLVSTGDVRFLQNDGPTAGDPTFPKATPAQGGANTMIAAPGDMTITAAQIYPATKVSARIQSADILTIQRYADTPVMPYSAFGTLLLDADVIRQGGVIRVPGGYIEVGNSGQSVTLLPGSVTSVSMAGLTMPYGGTVDGLTYSYDGKPVVWQSIAGGDRIYGVTLGGAAISVEAGAVVDMSGGGNLLGAGFISGRGGSVDVLRHPLIDANPAFAYSQTGNRVYAVVPGFAGGYAPVAPEAGAGDPTAGQQITIPAGVPGLPAGTYTLLPSAYALLPGAFRVELGAAGLPSSAGVVAAGNGSYLTDVYQSFANSSIHASLPGKAIISAADSVRRLSTYDEMSYSDFAVSRSQALGWARPLLPMDGGHLALRFTADSPQEQEAFRFDGTALFSGTGTGEAGFASVISLADSAKFEILGPANQKSAGYVSLDAAALDHLIAPRLLLGGSFAQGGDTSGDFPGSVIGISAMTGEIIVRSGAVLSAGEVMLVARKTSLGSISSGLIMVEDGAQINTLGQGSVSFDASDGYVFQSRAASILAISNGSLAFLPGLLLTGATGGPVAIGGCAQTICSGHAGLFSEGTIAMVSDLPITVAPTATYGTRNLLLGVDAINIGNDASFADASARGVLPQGLQLNQTILDQLLAGNQGAGIPKLENLILTARDSVNFFGSVNLSTIDPATGQSSLKQFVLNTPAIYGYGSSADTAVLTTDTLVWSGIFDKTTGAFNEPGVNVPAGPVIPGGAGTGHSTLSIVANAIELGFGGGVQVDNQVTLDRLALGFDTVNLTASQRISGNAKGTLSVYQAQTGVDVYTGGNLNITTPLLTGEAGSTLSITAGGALNLTAPEGASLASSNADALGATLNLKGGTISVASAIVLPSGRLTLTADGDIVLTDRARIDMSGRAVPMFDVTRYSWGGDMTIESSHGNVTQAAGSVIDFSAENNKAGSLTISALGNAAGLVSLAGVIRGTATGSYDAGGGAVLPWLSGGVDLRGQTIADFAGLNQRLTAGGIFGERAFRTRQGDLVIGDEVKANLVDISADGGSLTVNGKIDASGERVGTIRLAARDGLTLSSGAVLDAHGTVLRVDSDGDAIDSPNRAIVELTGSTGPVVLQSGATVDLRSQDAVARGTLTINAPRLTETDGDIAIEAGNSYHIRGARSIAVNGFWSYSPTDADGTIVQNNGGATPVGADGSIGLDQIDQRSIAFMANALANGNLQNRLAGLKDYDSTGVTVFHLRPGVEINSNDTPNGNLTVKGDLDLSGYRYGPNADRDPASASYGAGEPGYIVIRAAGNLDIKGSINDGFAPPPATPEDVITSSVTTPSFVTQTDIVLSDNVTLAERWVVPSNPFYDFNWVEDTAHQFYQPGDAIPAGTTIDFTYEGFGNFIWVAGMTVPATMVVTVTPGGQNWAVAPMLAPGALSWDIQLAGGADLQAANLRALQTAGQLAGKGNVTLTNPHFLSGTGTEIFSVVRTGTGDLDISAGGDFSQGSLYGIYTAGTQSKAIDGNGNLLGAGDVNPFNLQRGKGADNLVVGVQNGNDYEPLATGNNYQAWYPELGGNVSIEVGGDMTSSIIGTRTDTSGTVSTSYVGNWLWTQGNPAAGVNTAWWINFGTYALGPGAGSATLIAPGFTGIGALGGGNVTIRVGGDAGVLESRGSTGGPASQGLNLAIGSTGRVLDDGSVVKTGGGDLVLNIVGTLNPLHPADNASSVSTNNPFIPMLNDLNGVVTALRGSADVMAGAIGRIDLTYGNVGSNDPRAPEQFSANAAISAGGLTFVQGDATVALEARGDLVVGGFSDPGRLSQHLNVAGGSAGSFPLYSPATAFDALSAGGNLTPFKMSTSGASMDGPSNSVISNYTYTDFSDPGVMLAPPVMHFAALSGSAYFDALSTKISSRTVFEGGILLFPSPAGQFDMLVAQSIYGAAGSIDMSGAELQVAYGSLTTPLTGEVYNALADTVTGNSHAGEDNLIRIYAREGDIVNLQSGRRFETRQLLTETVAAEPVVMRAGRDLVNVSGLALNNDTDDVSSLTAGRDIIYANMQIAGPGLLDVTAGRNINQADQGQITSIGAIAEGDTRPGASVVMLAGAGAARPDYAALARYLDPANVADPTRPLADQPGKVARSYEPELLAWLAQQSGFAGTGEEARAYFAGLPADQQNIFLRQVYFGELRAGGREYNDPDSKRFGSYLRGRDVIAALFPQSGYAGDITMFGGAGVRTQFGGDIQMLAPGGQIVIGVEGLTPPPTAGVVTQGAGDIQMYSQGSILLGLSRIMTTFGGDILAWSAEGDINAGRGSKTTVLFTPPRRVYDNVGDVALAPQAPSSGAGIATLNPIPEVPAGDVDLIAPLGTIDAGEAGIRVSGNVNLAALQVVNAANIQVQGKSTGLPLIATVNVNALTNASAAATQAAMAAQDVVNRERTAARQALPSIFTVRVLGFGSEPAAGDDAKSSKSETTGYDAHGAVQVLGQMDLSPQAMEKLTPTERRNLGQ